MSVVVGLSRVAAGSIVDVGMGMLVGVRMIRRRSRRCQAAQSLVHYAAENIAVLTRPTRGSGRSRVRMRVGSRACVIVVMTMLMFVGRHVLVRMRVRLPGLHLRYLVEHSDSALADLPGNSDVDVDVDVSSRPSSPLALDAKSAIAPGSSRLVSGRTATNTTRKFISWNDGGGSVSAIASGS